MKRCTREENIHNEEINTEMEKYSASLHEVDLEEGLRKGVNHKTIKIGENRPS